MGPGRSPPDQLILGGFIGIRHPDQNQNPTQNPGLGQTGIQDPEEPDQDHRWDRSCSPTPGPTARAGRYTQNQTRTSSVLPFLGGRGQAGASRTTGSVAYIRRRLYAAIKAGIFQAKENDKKATSQKVISTLSINATFILDSPVAFRGSPAI